MSTRFLPKKKSVLFMAIILITVTALLVGGTSAWLNSYQATPQNVFIGSDLEVDLTEASGQNYTIIPADRVAKNPTVTVKANSEPCYVFLKPEESGGLNNYADYYIDKGWLPYGGFVIDGELDSLYKKDTTWYFDSTDDVYNDHLHRYLSSDGTTEHTGTTNNDVKLWVAYDSNYVYAYIKMYTTYDTAAIRMYYDPDPQTNDSSLSMVQTNESSLHGDAGVRVERNNLTVKLEGGFGYDKIAYNDAGYFYSQENLKPFTFTEGTKSGFGFEVRFPRNDDDSNTFKLNFACENQPSSANCAWAFGPQWWYNRASMRPFTFNDSDNPFMDDQTEGYYYRLVGAEGDAPFTADQTFTVLRGLNATDDYGGNMSNGYVQFRTTNAATGAELTNATLASVSETLSFKVYAIQQANLTLARAFDLAKPNLQ
ncbi:MAG: hypothetical protein IJP35_06920 [Clostridia bacterium]|nr:hypothetical protein [Clostridia bacterium]